jgi:2-oxoglutarate dehydrogenase E2 component (dihydrolipoamide succinyltransferase)
MAETKVIMPQMGESIFEGTLTKWLKKKGDRIERDEPLFEISTDKIDSEIPAPASGVVKEILVKEGETVQINTPVAVIDDGTGAAAEASAPAEQPARKETAPPKETPPPRKETAPPLAAPAAGKKPEEPEEDEEGEDGIRSSPLVRRIARENNIDLAVLAGAGTGINGRITKRDILNYIERGGEKQPAPAAARKSPASPPPVAFSGDVERAPMTPVRKMIAEHMILSRRTSAHVTTFFEVDCTPILQVREKLREEFERAGAHLTVTPFFVQAAANALKRFPILNSSVVGDEIVYKRAINIGIAVNLETGLIVPVIKNVDEKNLLGVARAINDLGERARTKKLTPADVQDGTFTVTNPGSYGSLIGTPIINQPQVAIMGMGAIKKRAVVINDAIAIRSIVILSLSFDHRIIDGAVADQFMADIQKQLENWQV